VQEIGEEQGDFGINMHRGLLHYHLGYNNYACQLLQTAAQIAQQEEDTETEASSFTRLGIVHIAVGNLEQAGTAYERALTLRNQLGQPFKTTEPLAGLAKIALIEGKPLEALGFVEKILTYMNDHSLDGTEEPMFTFLTCYQTLTVNNDPRALEVLEKAYTFLIDRAEKIKDESLRRSYLENVAVNCEIQKAYGVLHS